MLNDEREKLINIIKAKRKSVEQQKQKFKNQKQLI